MAEYDALIPAALPQGRAHIECTLDNNVGLWTDDSLGYEWLPITDPRLQEVRNLNTLPEHVGTIGRVPPQGGSLLIRGESGHALTALINIPEYANEYRGKVRLAYIDPPFNTGHDFHHYNDGLESAQWQTMMRDRLIQIRELLAENGTVWIHLDEAEESYGKILADNVFGRQNYLGAVVWQKTVGLRNDARFFSVDQDTIHVFAKNRSQATFVRGERTEEMNAKYKNPDNDPKGPWIESACTAASGNEKMIYPIQNPAGRTVYPPKGTYWRYSQKTFNQLLADNRIVWKNNGDSSPYTKRYLAEVKDIVNRTWWTNKDAGSGPDGKREITKLFPHREPFSTPKPEQLLKKVIEIGSEKGDIVLDCFAGSATTAAVAQKLGRTFITVEWSTDTFVNYSEPRLRRTVEGTDHIGIGPTLHRGQGFRILEVENQTTNGTEKDTLATRIETERLEERERTENMKYTPNDENAPPTENQQKSLFDLDRD